MTDYEREAMKKTRMKLGAWGWDEREIAMMERRNRHLVECMSSLIPTIRAQQITGMPHGSGVSDPVGRAVDRMEERREKYQAEIDKNNAEIKRRQESHAMMQDLIDLWLTSQQKQIIDLYYREGRTMEYIAGKIGYSREGIKKIEHKAVLKLSRRIG